MKTKYALTIWHHLTNGETFAFPIDAPTPWGGVIYPILNPDEWAYKGTLQKGMDVSNVKTIAGNRVKCTIGGASVNTANWAYD